MNWLKGMIEKTRPGLFILAGSFIVSSGWSWYHFSKHPATNFVLKAMFLMGLVLVTIIILKLVFKWLLKKLKRNEFWYLNFAKNYEELFFLCSLIFLVFFIEIEWVSIVYSILVFLTIFLKIQQLLKEHGSWAKNSKPLFLLAGFIFLLQAVLQYSAYHLYILDSNIRFYNIVLFRSLAMTAIWIFGFAVAHYLYISVAGYLRYFGLTIWLILFFGALGIWAVNIGILYYSGLFLSPIVLQHTEGAGKVMESGISYYLIAGFSMTFFVFVLVLRSVMKNLAKTRETRFLEVGVLIIALAVIFGLASVKNTPEYAVGRSFYNYYFGKSENIVLGERISKKLLRFGLQYNENEFYVNFKNRVFSLTSTKFLPEKFSKKKPNIVIIFLESFSSRLTNVYGDRFPDLTPNLKEFANDKNTTVFGKYYNASTPTITGSLSQLCSFLPPTGHNEIQNERKLQSHRLLCLPEILKKEAGFQYSSYITAVNKNYANKDGIFSSMGVDSIYGTKELSKVISGEPLSWGYSDHQLFPAFFDLVNKAPQPFLMMLATVDTHPPFDLAKDAINYGDGKKPVLNMIHSTDDAFGQFWSEFKKSELAKDTIVVAVADHAIFPGALSTDLFKEEAKTLTFYDENLFAIYIPDTVLPKKVDTYSSGIDFAPTLLQILDVNIPNSFEGHSIFDDRNKFPNVLGMHELGLYINQETENGRKTDYNVPTEIRCSENFDESEFLTLCDFKHFYEWKRQMFEEGRFWKQ